MLIRLLAFVSKRIVYSRGVDTSEFRTVIAVLMATSQLLDTAGTLFNFGFQLGVLPFEWSVQKKKFARPKELKEKLWKIIVALFILKQSHIAFVCIHYLKQERSAANRSIDQLFLLSGVCTVITQLFFWNSLDDVIGCYNSMYGFIRRIGKLSKRRQQIAKLACLALKSVPFTSIITAVGTVVTFWTNPEDPRYMYSLLPEVLKGFIMRVVCCLIEGYIIIPHVYLFFFVFFTGVLFAFGSTAALQKAKIADPRTVPTLASRGWEHSKMLVKIHTSISCYKQLEILVAFFNQVFRVCVSNLTAQFMTVHTLTVYTLVKHHKVLPMQIVLVFSDWIVLFLKCEIVFYFACGSLYETANKLMLGWKRALTRRDRRNAIRRPLGVKLAGYVKRNTALFIILIIFRASRGCLIAF